MVHFASKDSIFRRDGYESIPCLSLGHDPELIMIRSYSKEARLIIRLLQLYLVINRHIPVEHTEKQEDHRR